jgi:anti-anti-sigma factor
MLGGYLDPSSKEAAVSDTQSSCPFFVAESRGTIMVVRFTCPDLADEDTVWAVDRALGGLLAQHAGPNFVLNLAGVRSGNSLMLAKLIGFDKKVRSQGGQLALCAVEGGLYRMLEWTYLSKLFRFFPNELEAIEAIR